MTCCSSLLSFLGVVLLLRWTYKFCHFILPYLQSRSVERFLHGADTYALVTGASDGIGKAIAQELYAKGFCLILHGRDEKKLWKTADDIRESRDAMKDIKVWVADATSPDIDFEGIVAQWEKLDLSLVVHNVSPYAPRPET